MKRHEMAANKIKDELDKLSYIRDQRLKASVHQFKYDSDRQFNYELLIEIGGKIEGLQYALSLLED